MAVVTVLIALAARATPLASLLASGAAPDFDFQVWRPLVFALTTSSIMSAVLTGLLLVLIGHQIEPMIGSVQFAVLYLICGVGGSTAITLAGVPFSFEGSMCGLFGLMAASTVVKYVQQQDIRADIVLLTIFIIWAIIVGSTTWIADIGAVVVGAVSGWAWLQTRWSSYRRQVGAGLAILAVCLAALVVAWVM
ncbi:rhomboid family intramembrane serine protease [Cutibacterium sp. WCA-380-WT-3A]|uniref:Rhomboid family intramembrane serine protease n=1 Tax=Cutibacterium porci TaxID=2605781 RepID=A0A7K0J7D7_9ACTN|nr:rhomboid family intramembrane serine protease [Cutibacterium porci]MSS45865.1 rhomboid family intramembrane serine protease [Cutibacterium porci]